MTPARAGWLATRAVARIAERAASEPDGRATLAGVARCLGRAALERDSHRVASMRARIAGCPPSVFLDWSRDAAATFGDADAVRPIHEILSAVIEGIKIIDDIQDEEAHCLAADVGDARALSLALAALANALELTAALPFPDRSWRAAVAAIGRGIRETAIGQELETTASGTFESYWSVVDRKTPPLVATALVLGALAAGADPTAAAALTQLAVPLGRILQVGDDCNDALGVDATDWRAPHLNLLMLFSLSGPNGAELTALLRDGHNPDSLRAAQLLLLRDGALAYAVHALVTTMQDIAATLDTLARPNPAPLFALLETQREGVERLLRESGVDGELAGRVVVSA